MDSSDTGAPHPLTDRLEAWLKTRSGRGSAAAFAIGAMATGALAIGSLAIGRLAVGSLRIRTLRVDRLIIHDRAEG